MWAYEVSGLRVVKSWFEYRKKNPNIKRSSELDKIQPNVWRSEQTTDLLKLLDVLGELVALEPAQDELLSRVCSGPLVSVSDLLAAGVLPIPPQARRLVVQRPESPDQARLPLETGRSTDEAAGSKSSGSRPPDVDSPGRQPLRKSSRGRRQRIS